MGKNDRLHHNDAWKRSVEFQSWREKTVTRYFGAVDWSIFCDIKKSILAPVLFAVDLKRNATFPWGENNRIFGHYLFHLAISVATFLLLTLITCHCNVTPRNKKKCGTRRILAPIIIHRIFKTRCESKRAITFIKREIWRPQEIFSFVFICKVCACANCCHLLMRTEKFRQKKIHRRKEHFALLEHFSFIFLWRIIYYHPIIIWYMLNIMCWIERLA